MGKAIWDEVREKGREETTRLENSNSKNVSSNNLQSARCFINSS